MFYWQIIWDNIEEEHKCEDWVSVLEQMISFMVENVNPTNPWVVKFC